MQLLRGLIAGGVRNPVLVNLLMVCILAGGLISVRRMVREVYPEFALDHVIVEVAYPGASPEDVERGVCTPIEEALHGVRGVRKVSSSSDADFGTVWIRLRHDVENPKAVLDEVRERVGQITTLPPEAREPVIREAVSKTTVVNVAVFGELEERTLKQLARQVRDDLIAQSGISQVSLSGDRREEIIIEVSEEALLAFDLSLADVMGVVARSSLDVPAGVIRTADEEFTLRIAGQRYTAREYEALIVRERGGAVVRLEDVATVRDGFEETVIRGAFNGQPAVVVEVFKTPDEDTTKIARIVRAYVEDRQPSLPEGLKMSVWADASADIDSRIAMLVENGVWGIVLVFATLAVFLRFRVALWVAVGIPVAFAGALIIMHVFGETLNMISLFALIMVSGIIVDDAIVIADSIHARRRAGDTPELASIEGAHRVALPVLGASITTIIAFVPLLYVIGVMGKIIHVLPVVVIAAIVASAVEAFGILPAHLCHRGRVGADESGTESSRVRAALDRAIDHLITRWFRPLFTTAMRYRVVTVAAAAGALLAVVGLVAGGRTPLVLMPREDGNLLRARVRFPEGTPVTTTLKTIDRLEACARGLEDDEALRPASEGTLVRQIYSLIGEFADFTPQRGNNLCEVRVELMPAEQRRIPVDEIVERWRQSIGTVHDAIQVTIGRKPIGPIERPMELYLLG
ncbi:MAG: efflux RND transporter permease subunit, partial [Phycisphaerae bacterium]